MTSATAAGRIALHALGALACLVALGGTGCSDARSARPNIVLVVTDDQAAITLPYMPIVRRELAAKGTTLPNFILNDPLCCPSRVTILLGQYRHNHQLEVGVPGGCAFRFLEDHDGDRTIGALIQGAGYRTAMIGKYLNSYDRYFNRRPDKSENPLLTGWDDYHVLAQRHPTYFDFYMQENGELVRHNEQPPVYQTDYLSKRATDFIAKNAGEEPFFLYVAPLAPHAPTASAARHRNLFQKEHAPRGASFDPRDVSSQPSLATVPRLGDEGQKAVDRRFRKHLQALQAVDEMVGAIILELERTDQLENTFFLFTSDNGYHFGEHRIARNKATPFEESIRFPLIVRGPGVPAGLSRDELASNVDIHPTLLELIGLSADPEVDGRSLLPLLRSREKPESWRHAVVIESVSQSRNQGIPPFVGLRSDRFKLVSYRDGTRELYDLEADAQELRNVIGQANPALVDELSARLDELLHCHGESCRRLEGQPFETAPRAP